MAQKRKSAPKNKPLTTAGKKRSFYANRVRELRLEANLTQEQLAEKMGLTTITIRRIETNKSPITYENLLKLLNVLDISINYFFMLQSNSKDYGTKQEEIAAVKKKLQNAENAAKKIEQQAAELKNSIREVLACPIFN